MLSLYDYDITLQIPSSIYLKFKDNEDEDDDDDAVDVELIILLHISHKTHKAV